MEFGNNRGPWGPPSGDMYVPPWEFPVNPPYDWSDPMYIPGEVK